MNLLHAYADLLTESYTYDEAEKIYNGVRDAGGSHDHACGGVLGLTMHNKSGDERDKEISNFHTFIGNRLKMKYEGK